MAGWTVLYSGSNLVSTTETSLTLNSTTGVPAAKTDKGTISLVLDLSALGAGDQFIIRLYDKCRSTDTQRKVQSWIRSGVETQPIWISPAVMIGEGWDFTLTKLAGADQTITSEIRAYT